VAVVGELVTAGVAQHVWMDREWHLGGLAEALDEMMEAHGADRPAESEVVPFSGTEWRLG